MPFIYRPAIICFDKKKYIKNVKFKKLGGDLAYPLAHLTPHSVDIVVLNLVGWNALIQFFWLMSLRCLISPCSWLLEGCLILGSQSQEVEETSKAAWRASTTMERTSLTWPEERNLTPRALWVDSHFNQQHGPYLTGLRLILIA